MFCTLKGSLSFAEIKHIVPLTEEALLGEKQIVASCMEIRLHTGVNGGHAFPNCKCLLGFFLTSMQSGIVFHEILMVWSE